ncbi:hypothetical protein BGZ92_006383 [Podila epicladia]|nr:hypothetical protein BGZ92_006383 [Podila epicladia]
MSVPSIIPLMYAVCIQAPARIFILSTALALCWESVYRFVSKGSGAEYILRWMAYCIPGVLAALELIENTILFYAIVGFTLLTTGGILVQERRISVNARMLVFCIGLIGLL